MFDFISDRNENYCNNNELCKTCVYRGGIGDQYTITCDYFLIEEQRRGCAVSECDKYIAGNPIRKKSEF